ncbi:MAG: nucleotidyltransferase family protein [Lachnospiraceae bacterium]|nr:nucleotidyltransferase family protein [Lachnospiraceae bacterium]
MKAAGIIAEFNPLHLGHLHLIREARRITGADYILILMSGDFVQRGEPAIAGKHIRTRMALESGADAVLELPVPFSIASAEYFATAAVSLFHKTGVVTHLCFGAECTDAGLLRSIASMLLSEPPGFKEALKAGLKQGLSFPRARAAALSEAMHEADLLPLLEKPNNILALEYQKALSRLGSDMEPVFIKRDHASFPEAAALRREMEEKKDPEAVRSGLPREAYPAFSEAFGEAMPLFADDFSSLLQYKLLLESGKDLTRFTDLSPALEERIKKSLPSYEGFRQFAALIKTKDMTHSRIQRVLLHILLDLDSRSLSHEILYGEEGYLRFLGFRESAAPLIRFIRAKASVPVLTGLRDAEHLLQGASLRAFKDSIQASELYRLGCISKFHSNLPPERSRPARTIGDIVLF